MHESIQNFAKQFEFKPEIINATGGETVRKITVAGMGGSHLAADLLRMFEPELDIGVHRDYGLPLLETEELRTRLLVASSYSGNTEETLDFAMKALEVGLRPSVIASGGKLLELAKENNLPYVAIPNNVIQPRVALALSLLALSKLAGSAILSELEQLSSLQPSQLEKEGEKYALQIWDKVPLIYSSERNGPIAYNWKIKINETARIPAFCHTFPEFNHNEMAGFSLEKSPLNRHYVALFLKNENDNERTKKRMEISKEMLAGYGIDSINYEFTGDTLARKAFTSLITADWTAYYLAKKYGVNPDENPAVENFKKKMAN